jgi:hypothetical protein
MQDLEDFIFSLIRTPAFSEKVNDIEFECGNSLYQSILDRYIAGEDVPFTEVQRVCSAWTARATSGVLAISTSAAPSKRDR